MAQEFTINSSAIEDKINQLLPSQGGFGAGVDFSASTMVIPIVDLTESAEGSGLRVDLQSALSINNTVYSIVNSSSTVLNTTGYYRFTGIGSVAQVNTTMTGTISITDGITSKILYKIRGIGSSNAGVYQNNYDFIVFLNAGDSIVIATSNAFCSIDGSLRQIADVNGNLINP